MLDTIPPSVSPPRTQYLETTPRSAYSENNTPTILKILYTTELPKASKGVLITCDPSIKAIILKIDAPRHDFIVEDLDDTTALVKESMLPALKARLDEELRNTQQIPEESESE